MFGKVELLELNKELIAEKLNYKFIERNNIGKYFNSEELLKEIEKEIVELQELYKLIDSYLEYAMIEPYLQKESII
jgi:hypothetical protein